MKITVELNDSEWGQIVDGLTCRAELYENTVAYHEGEVTEAEIAEVSDAEEARALAAIYRSIIVNIRSQV